MRDVCMFSFTCLVLLVSSCLLKLARGLKSVDHLPGMRCLVSPLSLLGMVLPHGSWNPGLAWTWHWQHFVYKRYKSETISVVPYVFGPPHIYTTSLEVAQHFLNNSEFEKPPEINQIFAIWGENILSSIDDIYKRHRRIVGPALASGIAPLVWEETFKTYTDMVLREGWSQKSVVSINCFNDYSHKFALILISRCAFGFPSPWTASSSSEGKSDLDKAMSSVSEGIFLRTAAPRWMYKLPIKKLTELENACLTLEKFMRSSIASQRAQDATQDKEVKLDLLSRLVQANEAEGKLALDEDELVGNVFAFLFAGHETTSRMITVALTLLALHPEEQDIAVEEIQRELINGRDPVFNDFFALKKVLACFLEAGRMFPSAYLIARDTMKSVKLTTPTDEGNMSFVVAPGTRVVVDMIGISYNPRHFDEPDRFKPSRWYNADSDVTFFGLGPRACLGRKFAVTEAVCFITLLLRDWVVSPLLRDGETVAQWRIRVLRMEQFGVTLGVGSVPLKLTKRSL